MHSNVLLFCFLSIIILKVVWSGEFAVLKAPNSIEFQGKEPLSDGGIECVLIASLGLSVDPACASWPGLKIVDPFNPPKKLVIVGVSGVKSLDLPNVHSYSLNLEENVVNMLEELRLKLAPYSENSVIKEIDDPELFSNNIDAFSENEAENDDSKPKAYFIYIPISNQKEFPRWKNEIMSSAKTLSDKVLFITVSNENPIVRNKRETETKASSFPTRESFNVADDYDENFPVIFNIMLWFSISLLFSLIAISMVIGNMDPGRDSIIYRMTSTRMKKDN